MPQANGNFVNYQQPTLNASETEIYCTHKYIYIYNNPTKLSIMYKPNLKNCEFAMDAEVTVLLRVIRLISPSLLMKSRSSEVVFPVIFMEVVVVVIESVNCFGVRDPVLERVRIRLVSKPKI